jgi:hypothetical protein
MLRFVLTTLVAGALANVALPVHAQQLNVNARCELHYRDTIIGEGPCTAAQKDNSVVVKGTISENGKSYEAIINNRSNYGTLIGADTFILAEGKLVSNDPTRVLFGNDYELDIILPSSASTTVSRSSDTGAAAALIAAIFAGAVIGATQDSGSAPRQTEGNVTGLQDLVGARGRDAEAAMEQRGYKFLKTEKTDTASYSFWTEPGTNNCVATITSDGVYKEIVYTEPVDCQ